ncbi:MAG: hypothetical protein JNM82_15365 [Rhodocyclaceae bacterium]|nr:hypothetical protein [Rhodocyclaceae bacterium]
MLTLQARERFAAERPAALRTYPTDSPRAKARLVVLALLADGRLDTGELEGLDRRGVFAALGIARNDFYEVLYDFCSDLARLSGSRGDYLLTPAALAPLFAEVQGPATRQAMMRQIFDAIRSDGRLHAGEARLFWNAVDAWGMPPGDPFSPPRRRHSAAHRPEHYYG